MLWREKPQKVNANIFNRVDELEIIIPNRSLKVQKPVILARSALVLDVNNGSILFSKNPNLRFSPASVTKIMTALVTINHYFLQQVLIIDTEKVEGSKMGLLPGERISVGSLLYGMLLNSGNDAAYTLAKNFPGGLNSFTEKMNKTAEQIGLKNTHFADPAGLSDDENFTTTLDLAKLAQFALQNPIFAKIVATREKTVFDVTGTRKHDLKNLNSLLWEVPGVTGVKTGFTDRAGGVLVTSFKEQDLQILTVVFKSEDRFQDTKRLIDWAVQSPRER